MDYSQTDENFTFKHDEPFLLSMANAGKWNERPPFIPASSIWQNLVASVQRCALEFSLFRWKWGQGTHLPLSQLCVIQDRILMEVSSLSRECLEW